MISSLRGTIISQQPPHSLVIEVGGVGYKVNVPGSVFDDLDGVGRTAFLHTYLLVREDALTLFGFANEEQRSLFELLLTVQGVGPRLALSVLSTLSIDILRRAVANEQSDVLDRVPGVGKRTAEKIVFSLKDKLSAGQGLGAISLAGDVDTEVLGALTALGYSIVEAQAAVQSIKKGAANTTEERIMAALQYFSST